MDRETVITHLQIIHTWAEFARERDLQFFTPKHLEDIAQWSDDAIELLKEQDELLRKLQKDKDKLCLDVSEWKHRYHDRPLKEQEAVEAKTGHWIYKKYDDMFMCSSCEKYSVRNDYPYCHWCGAKMKQEGL
jgi:hypothetical protein